MSRNKLIVITGKSSSGKDTLLKNLPYSGIISTTTRPIRERETHGVNYYYTTNDEFKNKILNNEFIEYRTYNTLLNGESSVWYYGTEINAINTNADSCLVLDVQNGLIGLHKYFTSEIDIISFYIDCSDDIRKARAEIRGSFCPIEWDRRLIEDTADFSDLSMVNYILDGTKSISELRAEVLDIIKGLI